MSSIHIVCMYIVYINIGWLLPSNPFLFFQEKKKCQFIQPKSLLHLPRLATHKTENIRFKSKLQQPSSLVVVHEKVISSNTRTEPNTSILIHGVAYLNTEIEFTVRWSTVGNYGAEAIIQFQIKNIYYFDTLKHTMKSLGYQRSFLRLIVGQGRHT